MALGLIEVIGLSSAMLAIDAASKCADVHLVGCERVIGVGQAISLTLHIEGDVAAVQAAVEAGKKAVIFPGNLAGACVIPRPHEELDVMLAKYKCPVKKENKEKPKQKTNQGGK